MVFKKSQVILRKSVGEGKGSAVSNGHHLEIRSLTVHYAARPVLQDVTLDVKPGEVVALAGPNGAGKTTLIRAISGVLKPQTGTVSVDERDLASLPAARRARFLAVVPQARNLPPAFTVWQTVLLGRTPYLGWLGQPGEGDRQRVRWAMERTHTFELADRRVEQLSGGEQQRVLLARALAQECPILLLDEPTAHLDLQYQVGLLNLIRELAGEQKLAVLMALHDLNLAALYANRVALLVEGHLFALGAPQEVLTPEALQAVYKVPVRVIPHPEYGTPLVLPDGWAGPPA
jgi:iron complex transport system ATP-binding protein